MNGKKTWGLVAIILLASVVVYKMRPAPTENSVVRGHDHEDHKNEDKSEAPTHDEAQDPNSAVAEHNHASEAKDLSSEERDAQGKFIESALAKLPVAERESLLYLTEVMSEESEDSSTFESVVARLEEKGMAPFLMKDKNPDTGDMTVIRSKKTLPGTRYFHAQYFEDENGRMFAQHISFEFKPGTTSFDGAKAALMKQFKIQSAPTMEKEDFISWNQNGYTIWAKVQSKEDFAHDPFNAHDDNDVGTIRVAKELEIHDPSAPHSHAPAETVEE